LQPIRDSKNNGHFSNVEVHSKKSLRAQPRAYSPVIWNLVAIRLFYQWWPVRWIRENRKAKWRRFEENPCAQGRAAIDIVKSAKSHAADLIVIATFGLTGIRHLLLGSVTENVVRRAPCPVFTVKRFGKSPI
jgi:hypothetical protein